MRANQGGYIALALLLITTLAAAGTLTQALRVSNERSDIRARRDILHELRDAKRALIAHALMEDNTPGSLPCPTKDLDGKLSNAADNCGSGALPSVGRFPFYRLGMMKPQTGSQECLWYAVSGAHKNTGSVIERGGLSRPALNVAYAGGLTLTDLSTSHTVAAVLIEPGVALGGQLGARSLAGSTTCAGGDISAFLDDYTAISNADKDNSYVLARENAAFNDTVSAISHAELMQPLLRRVLQDLSSPTMRSEYSLRIAAGVSGTLARIRNEEPAAPTLFSTSQASAFDKLLSPAVIPTTYPNQCPTDSALLLEPVAWLCFNQWYALIDQTGSALDWTITLAMDRNDPKAMRCSLRPASGEAICQ